MSEIPKAQVGPLRSALDSTIVITVILSLAAIVVISQIKDCFVGQDTARAQCITAGGDELKCCKAFSFSSCRYLEPKE